MSKDRMTSRLHVECRVDERSLEFHAAVKRGDEALAGLHTTSARSRTHALGKLRVRLQGLLDELDDLHGQALHHERELEAQEDAG